MRLSVVMPVHNEVDTIMAVVERVQAVPLEKEIIVVDDASTDGSSEIISRLEASGLKSIRHRTNQGKGAAVRAGFDVACGDIVVVQDADLEYDPSDFVRLIQPIERGEADVVYGVRSLQTQKAVMRWGNRFVTWATNVLYGQSLKDMETCYKMMRREVALALNLECRGFDVEAETTAKLLRSGLAICELPIRYTARYENKKLSPLDGLPTLRALWRYRRWAPSRGICRKTASGAMAHALSCEIVSTPGPSEATCRIRTVAKGTPNAKDRVWEPKPALSKTEGPVAGKDSRPVPRI
jgi:glycosyltransferase involved in cell wall biosynthesis